MNMDLTQNDRGEHFVFDPSSKAPMVPRQSKFEGMLSTMHGLRPDVINKTLECITEIITTGCGSERPAMGCFVVIANGIDRRFLNRIIPEGMEQQPWLFPAELAFPPSYNKLGGPNKLHILDMTDAGKRFFRPDFVCTGGIILIDAQTSEIVASRVEAKKDMRMPEGTYDGVQISTLDDREAVGIAAQGECLVLTCTPENCVISGTSGGSGLRPAQLHQCYTIKNNR